MVGQVQLQIAAQVSRLGAVSALYLSLLMAIQQVQPAKMLPALRVILLTRHHTLVSPSAAHANLVPAQSLVLW